MSSLYERDAAVIAGIEKLRFFPLEVVSGHGSTLIDPAGRQLLDLSATWTASGLGHGHPAVAAAVAAALVLAMSRNDARRAMLVLDDLQRWFLLRSRPV